MLRDDEYRIILEIERARDHRAVLATLTRFAARAPVRSEEYRKRLVEALRWARERVRAGDRQQVLKSVVAVELGRGLLRALSAEHPAERAARIEKTTAVTLAAGRPRPADNGSALQSREALRVR